MPKKDKSQPMKVTAPIPCTTKENFLQPLPEYATIKQNKEYFADLHLEVLYGTVQKRVY